MHSSSSSSSSSSGWLSCHTHHGLERSKPWQAVSSSTNGNTPKLAATQKHLQLHQAAEAAAQLQQASHMYMLPVKPRVLLQQPLLKLQQRDMKLQGWMGRQPNLQRQALA
jgi:hypothetical protein